MADVCDFPTGDIRKSQANKIVLTWGWGWGPREASRKIFKIKVVYLVDAVIFEPVAPRDDFSNGGLWPKYFFMINLKISYNSSFSQSIARLVTLLEILGSFGIIWNRSVSFLKTQLPNCCKHFTLDSRVWWFKIIHSQKLPLDPINRPWDLVWRVELENR